MASQLTALLTAFIANVRARSRAVSASASGVVSGGSSSVPWETEAGVVFVVLGPCGGAGLRASVGQESKSVVAGWERTSGRCCEKNWCRRRSGALSGGWDARAMGAVEGAGRAGAGVALDGGVAVVVEGSSGKDEDCCCWVSPFAELASTRVGDFAEALAGGTTLGGFDELKNRPPGGFEKRE